MDLFSFDETGFDSFPTSTSHDYGPTPDLSGSVVLGSPGDLSGSVLMPGLDLSGSVLMPAGVDLTGSTIMEVS